MEEHVLGEWKQFVFKPITPNDHGRILGQLRKTFYRDELICKLAEFDEADCDLFDQANLLHMTNHHDLCFYAEDKASGKIAGIRVITKHVKGAKRFADVPRPPRIQNALDYINTFQARCDVFEKYGIDFYADLRILSVDPEFRKMGLATEIYRRTLAMLRAKGFPLCKSGFSSPYTRSAARKFGFVELDKFYILDFKNKKGEIVFPHADPDMHFALMVYKFD